MAVIVVFAAHNDDHTLAMGGTIAHHYKVGDEVHIFIGSFGELSHPHLKPEVIRKTRVKEAQRADRALGGEGKVVFLGLREFNFIEDFKHMDYVRKLAKRLRTIRPDRIYFPAKNDMHKDHQAINHFVKAIVQKARLKSELYTYYVYPVLRHPIAPRLLINTSPFFRRKINALSLYKSQIKFFSYAFTNNIVYLFAIFNDWLFGFLHGFTFAERFFKVIENNQEEERRR